MKPSQFLSAEWRKLVMANYAVDPSLLAGAIPPKTELDFFNGNCYISLVGFLFREVRVRGMRIPFHVHFPEVNLRFYVRHKPANEWKRGVVFIKEIVPKPAISFVANTFFGERYTTLPMKYGWVDNHEEWNISYQWKHREWNVLEATAGKRTFLLNENSEEEFITQHFWGYTAMKGGKTGEYHVTHPAWELYPVTAYTVRSDFAAVYGEPFGELAAQKPHSVFLAEGSAVQVFNKRII